MIHPLPWVGFRIFVQSHAEVLEITFLCLNVEVAIDFERLDLFREVESLFYFGRRDYNFLAVDSYANRHRETFNDSFIVKRQGLSVYAVSSTTGSLSSAGIGQTPC